MVSNFGARPDVAESHSNFRRETKSTRPRTRKRHLHRTLETAFILVHTVVTVGNLRGHLRADQWI